MSNTALDFGAPVPVEELPASNRGGRQSTRPAFEAWLGQIPVSDKYSELASSDLDGAHPAGRVQQLKKILADTTLGKFDLQTRPVEAGKRYRIFVKRNA